jgi:hypothetical protein
MRELVRTSRQCSEYELLLRKLKNGRRDMDEVADREYLPRGEIDNLARGNVGRNTQSEKPLDDIADEREVPQLRARRKSKSRMSTGGLDQGRKESAGVLSWTVDREEAGGQSLHPELSAHRREPLRPPELRPAVHGTGARVDFFVHDAARVAVLPRRADMYEIRRRPCRIPGLRDRSADSIDEIGVHSPRLGVVALAVIDSVPGEIEDDRGSERRENILDGAGLGEIAFEHDARHTAFAQNAIGARSIAHDAGEVRARKCQRACYPRADETGSAEDDGSYARVRGASVYDVARHDPANPGALPSRARSPLLAEGVARVVRNRPAPFPDEIMNCPRISSVE